jgi:hypothetical protein
MIIPVPPNVLTNGTGEYAVRPPTVTVTGENVAPGSTRTEREVAVAPITGTRTGPMKTMFAERSVLNPDPLIVSSPPILQGFGEIDEICGAAVMPGFRGTPKAMTSQNGRRDFIRPPEPRGVRSARGQTDRETNGGYRIKRTE